MSAILSGCKLYRYKLTRPGDLTPVTDEPLLFFMCNPSTADAREDDSTITRCRSFSASLGFNGVVVGNIYGPRSTDPSNLWNSPDPVGPENDKHLLAMAEELAPLFVHGGITQKKG